MATPRGGNQEREGRLQRTFLKNELVFFDLFRKEDFRSRLIRLSKKYFPTDPLEKKFSRIDTGWVWRYDNRSELRKITSDVVKMMPFESQFNLNGAVNKLLKDYRLGSEWLSTMYDFVILGWLLPPIYNLAISQGVILPTAEEWASRDRKGGWARKARATLTLNPDTTLDDMKDAWPEIKKHQKASWSGYKSFKFSPKAIIRDYKVREIDRAKINIPDDVKFAELTSYEESLAKKFRGNPKAARKAILQYRRDQGKKTSKIKIKTKLTDLDVVKKELGLKGGAANRAAAALRQRRHRRKNVTPFLP